GAPGMRRGIVALGIAIAVGGLAHWAHRPDPSAPDGAQAPRTPALASATPSPSRRIEQIRRASERDKPHSIARRGRAGAEGSGGPELLVAAVSAVESEFNPRAVSRRGALGLMQLMPGTAAVLGVRYAFDPRENVDAGARYLRELLNLFANDVAL